MADFLAFVRSGSISIADATVANFGYYGYYRSSIAISSFDARFLNFNTANVSPSGSGFRWRGFPLRCLYPGSA